MTALHRQVSFHVAAHNTEVPHSAFRGETPDEIYFGTGKQVPRELADEKKKARMRRLYASLHYS